MTNLNHDEHVKRVTELKKKRGVVETEEYVDAFRNKGANRTPEKRELLKAIDDRAKNSKNKRKAYY